MKKNLYQAAILTSVLITLLWGCTGTGKRATAMDDPTMKKAFDAKTMQITTPPILPTH